MRRIVATVTVEEYEGHREEYNGICLACGNVQFGGCEPDMEDGACDACGSMRLCGFEQALLMGRIAIVD
jgi:hypothetical protein